MTIKIIDSDAYDQAGITTMFFPGGEPHVKIPEFQEDVILYLKARTWNDTTFGALVIDALKRQGRFLEAFIPYFPAARQDKTNGRAPLTLELIGDFIGHSEFSVFDPHSSKINTYTYVVDEFMPTDLDLPIVSNVVGIVAPDRGAHARAAAFRDKFYPDADEIICEKVRNQDTGYIERYDIVKPPTRAGHYIVVDDICDGGFTFNLLATALDNNYYGKDSTLELFVSHGIFSKGLDAISPRYTKITTTDSWCRLPSSDRLSVVSLTPILQKLIEMHQNA